MPKRRLRMRRDGVPIDHSRIIDGFGEMADRDYYEDYETVCGRCGTKFVFTAIAQQHVHETRGVPIKMARRGAAYCRACAEERGAENRASRELVRRREAVGKARTARDAAPDDAPTHMAYLEARVRLFEVCPSERARVEIEQDIRRAHRLMPEAAAPSHWEERFRAACIRIDSAKDVPSEDAE